MKFSSSDLSFWLAIIAIVFASGNLGFSLCLFLIKYHLL